jgi:excisionase family DNA binding protein
MKRQRYALTVKEFAAELGESETHVRDLIAANVIRSFRVGIDLRITRCDANRYLEDRGRPPFRLRRRLWRDRVIDCLETGRPILVGERPIGEVLGLALVRHLAAMLRCSADFLYREIRTGSLEVRRGRTGSELHEADARRYAQKCGYPLPELPGHAAPRLKPYRIPLGRELPSRKK